MSKTTRGEERRTRRVATEAAGEVLGRAGGPLQVVDLSSGGCLVSTEKHLAPGAVLDVRFGLADGELTAKAQVVESSIDGSSLEAETSRYLSGLRFLDLKPPDEQRLLRYLADSGAR